jgi:hypothetical protein
MLGELLDKNHKRSIEADSTVLKVAGKYIGAVSYQLTDGGRGEKSVLRVTENLSMCDRGGALYSVKAIV